MHLYYCSHGMFETNNLIYVDESHCMLLIMIVHYNFAYYMLNYYSLVIKSVINNINLIKIHS